jgi:hypothetical protein
LKMLIRSIAKTSSKLIVTKRQRVFFKSFFALPNFQAN